MSDLTSVHTLVDVCDGVFLRWHCQNRFHTHASSCQPNLRFGTNLSNRFCFVYFWSAVFACSWAVYYNQRHTPNGNNEYPRMPVTSDERSNVPRTGQQSFTPSPSHCPRSRHTGTCTCGACKTHLRTVQLLGNGNGRKEAESFPKEELRHTETHTHTQEQNQNEKIRNKRK